MKSLILALFLPYFCLGFGPKSDRIQDSKIYKVVLGGDRVRPEDQIWKSSVLIKSNKDLCSGVIIDSKVVLTAAHCLDDVDQKTLKVYFGFSPEQYPLQRKFLRVNEVVIRPEYKLFVQPQVKHAAELPEYIDYNLQDFMDFLNLQQKKVGLSVYAHPDFTYLIDASKSGDTQNDSNRSLNQLNEYLFVDNGYDVALLFLEEEIPSGFRPAEIISPEITSTFSKSLDYYPTFVVTGYGVNDRITGELKNDLRMHDNNLIQVATLKGDVFMFYLSTLDPSIGNSCMGDSGSGIYYKGNNKLYLAGIVSSGINFCANYTMSPNLDFHRQWIDKTIEIYKSQVDL